jgi:hypothetical protein
MASNLQPIVAHQTDTNPVAAATTNVDDTPEPAPITDQEVGEYREQDRFLPVRSNYTLWLPNAPLDSNIKYIILSLLPVLI